MEKRSKVIQGGQTQTDVHTCNLDDGSDPVDFTGQDCVCVQDLHLHAYDDVIPLGTQGSLQAGDHMFPYRSSVLSVSCYSTVTPSPRISIINLSIAQNLLLPFS